MSEKLAISATLSVLMMAGYVLFGNEAAREPLSVQTFVPPVSAALGDALPNPSSLLPISR